MRREPLENTIRPPAPPRGVGSWATAVLARSSQREGTVRLSSQRDGGAHHPDGLRAPRARVRGEEPPAADPYANAVDPGEPVTDYYDESDDEGSEDAWQLTGR